MRSPSRPNFRTLSPDEQAQNDAEHQRDSHGGFFWMLLAMPATLFWPLSIIAASTAWGW